MREAICDFCPASPTRDTIPPNCSLPKDWLDFRILAKGRAVSYERLMCPSCQEERNIESKPHSPSTIADVILVELYDGIRDIASDVMGDG